MPYKTLLGFTSLNTLYNKVCAFVLLITAHNFKFSKLFISRENSEITEDIEYSFMLKHCHKASLNIGKCALILTFRHMPRAPVGYFGIYGTITETFTFGGKVEKIGYKHSRDTFFIIKNILSTINPRYSFTCSGLDFANDNRETVNQQYYIKTFSALYLRIYPLICNNIAVFSHFLFGAQTKICNRNKTMIFAKRKRILFKYLIFKLLVYSNEISSTSLHKERS